MRRVQPATGSFVRLSMMRPLIDDVPDEIGPPPDRCCAGRSAGSSSDITGTPIRIRFKRMSRDSLRRDAMRIGLAGVMVMIASVSALAQTQPPPPAPAPGSPAIFKSAADLAAVLAKATANAGGMSSSNVTTTDQYRVSLVKRDKAAGALAHPGNTELLYIVEGAGTVITGGTLVPGGGGKPASIANGVS